MHKKINIKSGAPTLKPSSLTGKNQLQGQERRSNLIEQTDMTESEARQLMLRLEELARLEGLREEEIRVYAPAAGQDSIDSNIQALIDSKANEDEVLKHDGSVAPSSDWDAGSARKITIGELRLEDANSYINVDGSGNLTFTDANAGTRILKSVGCPTHIFIKAINQPEGDLHLSDANSWGVSKALIKVIRVITSATDWDLYILQNDNGHVADDANIPEMKVMESGNGNADIYLDLSYEDEDASDEVHLYYFDNSGSNTADIYIIGYEMV